MNRITIFETNLKSNLEQLYNFHGAFAGYAGELYNQNKLSQEDAECFTNRSITDKTVFTRRYAKIQYRVWKEQLVVWTINEGAVAMQHFLEAGNGLENFEINGRVFNNIKILKMHSMEFGSPRIETEKYFRYNLERGMLLSSENKRQYDACVNFVERVRKIESIMLNQVVDFLKCVDALGNEKVLCRILEISKIGKGIFQTNDNGIKRVRKEKCFDLEFETNVLLPDGIAMGGHKAYGYGVVTQKI